MNEKFFNGELIQEARGKAQKTQLDVAYESGVSPNVVILAEKGRARNIAKLVKLLDLLGLELRVQRKELR